VPARTRERPSIVEQVDHTAKVVTLSWGRSVLSCDDCGSSERPAGYELKVDGRLIERYCGDCAGARPVDKHLERARDRWRARRR
jgi:hypothetical protein